MTAQIDVEWLAHHLQTMRQLKKPTLPQSVILKLAEMAEMAELMPTDRRRLIAAITAEKAAIKATQMQNRLGFVLARENITKRKLENRRKFILGELALAEAQRDPPHRTRRRNQRCLPGARQGQPARGNRLSRAPPLSQKADRLCLPAANFPLSFFG